MTVDTLPEWLPKARLLLGMDEPTPCPACGCALGSNPYCATCTAAGRMRKEVNPQSQTDAKGTAGQ